MSKKPTIEELQEAVAKADALAEAKANFLATMSHEIRTPMQSVYGLLELIGEENPPPNIQSMVTTAKQSASGLLEILDDILDFAKMDADKMELDVFEVPVRTLIYGILEALSVKVHGQHVELRHDIMKDVPFVIIGDPKRLRQIIMNLAGNALKFTEKGTVTVRVTTQCQVLQPQKNKIVLRFEVEDTGIGMKQEIADRLFQPFTQADSSTSRKFGGTGLGLSICKKLVDLMGGKIGVTSTAGKGSTFWFEIPTEEVSTETTTLALPTLDGISVLSVEDHPQGAKEIVRSLESMGATVESCPTYKEGLELARRRPFDVGIIDQGLPDGLGIDLIREIVKIRPFMGLVMYTVRDDVGLQHSLQSLGVAYLSKPASRQGLGEAVQDAARKNVQMSIDGPTQLLIAEDTESVRDVLRRQLEKLSVAADFVTNGREALEALKSGKYGILFTDLHMPEIDGYAVVKTIREQEEKTGHHFPVIALTADVQMAQRQIYLSHGFDECLLKPVSLGQFRRLLARWGLLGEEQMDIPAAPDTAAEPPDEHGALPSAIDLEAVKVQMGDLDDSTVEMLKMFPSMVESVVTRLKNAQEQGDFHELREAAHSLKGGARSACCTVLGDIAAQIQARAEDNQPCDDLVPQALAEFERVRHTLENLKI
ncbi:MAG: response regulator [Rhodospirillales bacterium]|nr:response regulator [Rhodospirillales bacterium]